MSAAVKQLIVKSIKADLNWSALISKQTKGMGMIKILNKSGEVLLTVELDKLRDANLRSADLRGADLRGADMRDANLRSADLRGADLRGADLRGADLRGADLRDANLRSADLRGADLSSADLRSADLRGANLSYANLRGADLIIITWAPWTTYITKGHIRIGCQSHTLSEWREFSDNQISEMDSRALDFWKKNKELIFGLCERFEEKEKVTEKSEAA